MKNFHGVIALTVLGLALMFSQSGVVLAENTEGTPGIPEAMKLYSRALPMQIDAPERAELLNQSAEILRNVIGNDPGSLEAHRKLVGVYLLQQDYSNAIRTMQDAITLSPEDPKLFVSLAFLYEHSGAYEYSEAMLDRALELDPDLQLAKDYKVIIRQKIDARNTEQFHDGEAVTGTSHRKAEGGPHHAIDPE